MEGWGTTESLSNPVLHNQSVLSTGKLRPGSQGQSEAGLEPWHRAMTREAVFFSGLYPFTLGLETEAGAGKVRFGEPEQAPVGDGRFLQNWTHTWSKSGDGRKGKMVAMRYGPLRQP